MARVKHWGHHRSGAIEIVSLVFVSRCRIDECETSILLWCYVSTQNISTSMDGRVQDEDNNNNNNNNYNYY